MATMLSSDCDDCHWATRGCKTVGHPGPGTYCRDIMVKSYDIPKKEDVEPVAAFDVAQMDGPLIVWVEDAGERARWRFSTDSVIDPGSDHFLDTSSLVLPLKMVERIGDKRYAIDAHNIIWISHYESGTPAFPDGETLVRPNQRDAMFALNSWAPDALERWRNLVKAEE